MDKLAHVAGDADALSSDLADDMPLAIPALRMVERFERAFRPFNATHDFSVWSEGEVHPLTRTALAILRLRKIGGAISKDQEKFVKFCEEMFKDQMAKHRASGEAGEF